MASPYPPLATQRPATTHVTPAHHYLALATGGGFARTRTDTGWLLTLGGQPATLLAALTASVLAGSGLIAWMTWTDGEVSTLTPAGREQLHTWERALDGAAR